MKKKNKKIKGVLSLVIATIMVVAAALVGAVVISDNTETEYVLYIPTLNGAGSSKRPLSKVPPQTVEDAAQKKTARFLYTDTKKKTIGLLLEDGELVCLADDAKSFAVGGMSFSEIDFVSSFIREDEEVYVWIMRTEFAPVCIWMTYAGESSNQ